MSSDAQDPSLELKGGIALVVQGDELVVSRCRVGEHDEVLAALFAAIAKNDHVHVPPHAWPHLPWLAMGVSWRRPCSAFEHGADHTGLSWFPHVCHR